MTNRSKLLRLGVKNIGCIGREGVEIALDDVVCLVGKNNAGKSTILRAYELAIKPGLFDPSLDRCRWAPDGELSVVELDVHIPAGVANVDDKWKEENGNNLVVRSRWEFYEDGRPSVRKTWEPQTKTWSAESKASGADNVFNSRLPRPLRIGSLQDASEAQDLLINLALSPFTAYLNEVQKDPTSTLATTVSSLTEIVRDLSRERETHFSDISKEVQERFSGVFPGLDVHVDITMAEPKIKLADLLKQGSGIRVKDGEFATSLEQQGAGARRALFWSMLAVHNMMTRRNDTESALEKAVQAAKKKGEKKMEEAEKRLSAFKNGHIEKDQDDPALPGFLLMIDEPENALHPMAARAAQQHLYRLAKDPEWQVIMTTHSPFFVNPFEDHTTIVRLDRSKGDNSTFGTKTYRSDEVIFDSDMKANLNALQQMDSGFCEIFFGSYPILVEGDTEHAAFIAAIVDPKHELAERATVIRARGKFTLVGLIEMLIHFRVPFSIVHDIDFPLNKQGRNNGVWTENKKIYEKINYARSIGISVNHRCSVPDFERFLGGTELGKDKPLDAYKKVSSDPELRQRIQTFFVDICDGKDPEPFGPIPNDRSYLQVLEEKLQRWRESNEQADNERLTGDSQKKSGTP